jgi:hypothetical protein
MENMSKKALQEIAASKNVYFTKSDTKKQLIRAIEKHDEPFFPASMSAKTSRHR